MTLRLRIQDLHPHQGPMGEGLVDVLRSGLARGGAPPVAVVVRSEVVHLVGLRTDPPQPIAAGRLLAGLTRARFDDAEDAPVAVGLLGRFELRRRRDERVGVPMVQVFLEWGDCSWWHWRALLDADGALLDDSVTVRSAQLGDALPGGLGRWWSTGRRHRLQLQLRRQRPTVPVLESTVVN